MLNVIENQTMMTTNLRWLWLVAFIFFPDQFSKVIITHYLAIGDSITLLPFANIMLAHNTGAAFSLLNQAGGYQQWLFGGIAVVVSAILLMWLYRLPAHRSYTAAALCLIIGGALGNLTDRLLHGYVIDFIQLHAGNLYWPTFNMADSSICIGAAMIAWGLWSSEEKA